MRGSLVELPAVPGLMLQALLGRRSVHQEKMIRGCDLGHKMGIGGIPWRRPPPGYRV